MEVIFYSAKSSSMLRCRRRWRRKLHNELHTIVKQRKALLGVGDAPKLVSSECVRARSHLRLQLADEKRVSTSGACY